MTVATASTSPASTAFDAVAEDYDRAFSHRTLGRWLPQAVHSRLDGYAAGDRVIELGCGTGEDALWLARRGVDVVAIDASPAMLSMTERKLRHAGLAERVRLEHFDLNTSAGGLERLLAAGGTTQARRFDGCLSNFGALNCVVDRPGLAAAVAGALQPGARFTAVIMGPVCAWEIATFAPRGRLPSACRRLRGRVPARIGNQTVVVDYPMPRRLRRELAPWFRVLGTCGIGVLLPPSQLADLVDRHTSTFDRLRRWENRIAHLVPAAWVSDHYLLELERRETTPS